MALPPKTCPQCGEEYLHTAELCVHCDVALVLPEELRDAPESLPPANELQCVRAASVGWARGLSERLREAGIPHRIEAAGADDPGSVRRPGHNLPYGVYVRGEDLEAAAEIDAQHMSSEIPDLPEDFETGASDVGEACPACGEPLDPEASECAGCGLAIVAVE